jgi:hypothetical protein
VCLLDLVTSFLQQVAMLITIVGVRGALVGLKGLVRVLQGLLRLCRALVGSRGLREARNVCKGLIKLVYANLS